MSTTQNVRLDGDDWLIALDPANKGRDNKWQTAPPPGAKTVTVPSTIQESFPNQHGLAWYWKSFKTPSTPHSGGRVLLRFWMVDYKADVWLNGQPLGNHEDPEEPFLLDATAAIKPGADNLLAVRVLNPTNDTIDGLSIANTASGAKSLPHEPGREWNFGGILDSVELLVVPALRIEDLQVLPDWKTGKIKVEASVRHYGPAAVAASLALSVAPAEGGNGIDDAIVTATVPPGLSVIHGVLHVQGHRLWDLDTPNLYRVTARLGAEDSSSTDEQSVRCGFRDFDFTDGYFRLNGRRLFIRSAHSLWTTPVKIHSCQDQATLRKDVIYAKTMGFNTIRFLPYAATRGHLELCDELGMMVMQQSMSSWTLGDSPEMPERFNRSLLGIVRRDRNHPCVALWYFLNETSDGPVFRHAVTALPAVRELDNSRVCLLSSGRWDKEWNFGGLSRPGSKTWDTQLGDTHNYLETPHRQTELSWLRQHVWQDQPTILSEYGIASAIDLPTFVREYERRGASGSMDALYYRDQLDKFMTDWRRWHLGEVFGRPEDYFKACLVANAEQRRLGMNAIRSNPHLVGYSMTALHDEVSCGEGPITFFRDLKPGAVDALRTGFAALKWCLFVEPWHVFQGGTVQAEVALANEDALRPGEYEVEVTLFDPNQKAALREVVSLVIKAGDAPFALPVWKKELRLDGPAGTYRLTANFVSGAAAVDGEATFQVSSPASMPEVAADVALWPGDPALQTWFEAAKIPRHPFAPGENQVILAGQMAVNPGDLQELLRQVERGATAILLAPHLPLSSDSSELAPRWTVFESFEKADPEPETSLLTAIPETLELGGRSGRRRESGLDAKGLLQVMPQWEPAYDCKVAYVYIPLETKESGRQMFYLTADYWLKAWIDGKPLCDTLKTGNGGPVGRSYYPAVADLKAGRHLLVVKVVGGSGGWAMGVKGPIPIAAEADNAVDGSSRFPWLPFKKKGDIGRLDIVGGFYHRDDWARQHPIFAGLPAGLLDWELYRNIVPQGGYCLQGMDEPEEAVCGALQTCFRYNSGLYVAVHKHGEGRIILSCLELIPNLGKDPVADRLLRNLLNYAATPRR